LIKGDSGRLRQILFNLVGNAIKFSEDGDVTITTSHRTLNKAEIEIRCMVTDTGIGIDQKHQGILFNRFEQVDNSISEKFGGTGLGLSISKQLVGLMGGEIGVDSALGQGSTFWFTIRSKPGEAPAPVGPASIAAAAPKAFEKLRVLVAEDNHVNQMLLEAILKSAGMHADIVGNGREAVEALKSIPYDVVLMDVQMPEMDGPTAAKAIRMLPGDAANVSIIALTANAMPEQREEYMAAGMNDFVTKPIDPKALFDALARSRRQL